MRKNNRFFLIACVVIVVAAIVYGVFGGNRKDAASPCTEKGKTYTMQLFHNMFVPRQLIVKKCDEVVIENVDSKEKYMPGFGIYPKHTQYDGFVEKVLSYKQKNSFLTGVLGVFPLSDFIKGRATGTLVVLEK